jgi:NAD/NADP transhydrogenase beta subunit
MAVSIVVVWLVTVVVAVVLFRSPLGDRARTLGIRSGLVIGLVGMALAFLMTGPTGAQLNDYQGIAGAHAVGVADGGVGLPLLGWSTEGGDLRIPHFVGMHALQALPLLVIALELLARRVAVLRIEAVRYRLVLVGAVGFAGTVGLVLWQALRGQSIVAPDAATIAAGSALTLVLVAGVVVTLLRGGAGGRSTAAQERAVPASGAATDEQATPTSAEANR